MQVNDLIYGFRVLRVRECQELSGRLWEMRHETTGARLAWLENGQHNKLFSIAFKTLPRNDTGVFHILEHSVLNGSKRYPVKEPFVNLLKSSMNTFLNAVTFPDKTVFPVSSRNEQDFLNLTNVYLDAVFCPAIYENPNIFYQEGWHYELEGEDALPSYNGVVFNEMKGAFSSPDSRLWYRLMQTLFPDTCYGYISGGDPAHIPELSYEEFIASHREFYHPGNSYTYLDGDLPIERVLEMICGYFDAYSAPEKTHEITLQGTLPHQEAEETYEAEDDGPAMLIAAQRMSTWNNRQELMALAALTRYLSASNEAPLKKAILASGIAQEATLYVEDSIAQPFVGLEVKQMDASRKDELMALVEQQLRSHVIDKAALTATIDQMEFAARDIREPAGVERAFMSLTTWLPGGDPLDGMTFNPLFAALRENLEADYFQKLLDRISFTGDDTAILTLLPSSTKGQEDRQAEQARLEAAARDWTEQDRKAILALNENLKQWQCTQDSPEDLAKLPVLPLSQIDSAPEAVEAQRLTIQGRPVLLYKTASQEISHFTLSFALADMSLAEMQLLSFLTELLGELPTASHSAQELDLLKRSNIGHLDYKISIFADRKDSQLCRPYFTVSMSCLTAKQTQALELVKQILLTTQFSGEDARQMIRIILSQSREALYQGIIASGNRYASLRAGRHYFASSALSDQVEGCEFYWYLKDLEEHFEDRIGNMQQALTDLTGKIFCAARCSGGLAAAQESPAFEDFFAKLPAGEFSPGETMRLSTDGLAAREAIFIPAAVSYAASSGKCEKTYHGGMDVLSNILNYDYLWNEVRVKGGAYGCGFWVSITGGISFSTYRDPSPVASVALFPASGSFIEEFSREDGDLTQYIIGAAASQDPLMGDRGKLGRVISDEILGITHGERRAWRQQLLAMTRQTLRECASWLTDTPYATCVVGPRDALADQADWEHREL